MTKPIFLTIVFILFFNITGLMASDSSFDIKAGISYPNIGPSSPKKIAIDTAFSFNLGLEKYFALGFETGFNWISWEAYTGRIRDQGITSTSTPKTSNAYSIPLLLNARVRFDLRKKYKIMPYIAVGAGYSWTIFIHPDEKSTYSGFLWQALAGIAIRPKENKDIEIIFEAGYRSCETNNKSDYDLNMSGFITHTGVRFSFGELFKISKIKEKE